MIIDSKSRSLEDKAFFSLEEDILTGVLKKGTSLTELALSEKLGVSRTPIRSALHRLAEDGLVDITPNRGAVVIGVDMKDLIDIYKIRKRLEGLASQSAASNISDEYLLRLTESVELAEFYLSKNDTERIKELDTEFHKIIYEASGNSQLEKILTELHRKIKNYRKISLTVSGRLEASIYEHREILEAIKAKDAALADSLTSRHIDAALQNVIAAFSE